MTRDISAEQAYAVGAPTVHAHLLLELEFLPEPMLLWTGLGNMQWGNRIFAGVGALLGVGQVEEAAEVRSIVTTLTLSAVPGEVVDAATNIIWQNRPARVWLALLTASAELIGDPMQVFVGRMDTLSWQEGADATLSLSVETHLVDLDRARVRRYTDADQQAEFPGDRGLEFVAALVEKDIKWGRG